MEAPSTSPPGNRPFSDSTVELLEQLLGQVQLAVGGDDFEGWARRLITAKHELEQYKAAAPPT